jgi:hypothetical protein
MRQNQINAMILFSASNKLDLGIGRDACRERANFRKVSKIDRNCAARSTVRACESQSIAVMIRLIYAGDDVDPSTIGRDAWKRASPNTYTDDCHLDLTRSFPIYATHAIGVMSLAIVLPETFSALRKS